MPDWGCGPVGNWYDGLPRRVYRGFYGLSSQQKIVESQRSKGKLAVFPDCKRLW